MKTSDSELNYTLIYKSFMRLDNNRESDEFPPVMSLNLNIAGVTL